MSHSSVHLTLATDNAEQIAAAILDAAEIARVD